LSVFKFTAKVFVNPMLRELHIQNYAVIEELSLEFHAGLNLLSGETGSGKSILVDAFALTLGGRASPEIIRTGAERASVTAVFAADAEPRDNGSQTARRSSAVAFPWTAWFAENDLEGGEDPEVILRREIHSSGRSRLLVNDQAVTAAAVRNLARELVEVHSQGEHVALFFREEQLKLLDQFAGLEAAVDEVGKLFGNHRRLERELETLSQSEQERLRAIDLLSFQAQEIEQAKLEPGEDGRLEDEKRILSNLEKIRAAASTAFAQLYEDEGSACSRLGVVERALDELDRYDPAFSSYDEPLSAARAALDDLARALRDYLGKLDANPRRLDEIEDRLALVDRLKRKYGQTVEEVLAYGRKIREQLANLEHADRRRAQIGEELRQATAEYDRAAQTLSRDRRVAARKFEKRVHDELAQVGMEKTRFGAHFESGARGWRGTDGIDLRISPNSGEEMRPLAKIASGGELSRLMLALKTVAGIARSREPAGAQRLAPTFVFDEVDAGIGGRVAESVGQRLKRLARDTQVLCVTHLPQIACFADHHYYVEKFERAGRTVTAVRYLESHKERAAELARMLSGSQITDAVLKHAAAMIKQAATMP
jgi:DNA repair protein RecN (Recombination protein N)